MDKETRMMFNSILEEMGRMEERIERKMNERFDAVDRRFERIESELEQMHHEINACKLEKGTIELLFRKIDRLEANGSGSKRAKRQGAGKKRAPEKMQN